MKKIKIKNATYEIIENYKEAFDLTETEEKLTEYFDNYDYILGDIAYNKLRLKGFCDKKNKMCNSINDYNNIKKYIKENCAYECKYFILKKITD